MMYNFLIMLSTLLRVGAIMACALVVGCSSGGDGGGAPPAPTQAGPAASVTLQWDSVTVSDLGGYKLYQSTSSGSLGSLVKGDIASSVTTYTVGNLQVGTTYFFVVKAYDTSGNESPSSNQVSWSAP